MSERTKGIRVSDGTHKQLAMMKIEGDYKTFEEVIIDNIEDIEHE